jgi:hypothetical protein
MDASVFSRQPRHVGQLLPSLVSQGLHVYKADV